MPSARRKAFLLTFVAAWTKVRRLAGRDPPILLLTPEKKNEGNRLNICCPKLHKNSTCKAEKNKSRITCGVRHQFESPGHF